MKTGTATSLGSSAAAGGNSCQLQCCPEPREPLAMNFELFFQQAAERNNSDELAEIRTAIKSVKEGRYRSFDTQAEESVRHLYHEVVNKWEKGSRLKDSRRLAKLCRLMRVPGSAFLKPTTTPWEQWPEWSSVVFVVGKRMTASEEAPHDIIAADDSVAQAAIAYSMQRAVGCRSAIYHVDASSSWKEVQKDIDKLIRKKEVSSVVSIGSPVTNFATEHIVRTLEATVPVMRRRHGLNRCQSIENPVTFDLEWSKSDKPNFQHLDAVLVDPLQKRKGKMAKISLPFYRNRHSGSDAGVIVMGDWRDEISRSRSRTVRLICVYGLGGLGTLAAAHALGEHEELDERLSRVREVNHETESQPGPYDVATLFVEVMKEGTKKLPKSTLERRVLRSPDGISYGWGWL